MRNHRSLYSSVEASGRVVHFLSFFTHFTTGSCHLVDREYFLGHWRMCRQLVAESRATAGVFHSMADGFGIALQTGAHSLTSEAGISMAASPHCTKRPVGLGTRVPSTSWGSEGRICPGWMFLQMIVVILGFWLVVRNAAPT
jgi:hypothetical protein